MDDAIANAYLFVEVAVIGGFMLLYPRIARKGLLFGAYVGEERAESKEARAIARAWYGGTIAAIALALAVAGVVALRPLPRNPLALLSPTIILGGSFAALYLFAYARARRLAAGLAAPPEAPPLPASAGPGLALPWAVLAVAVLSGFVAIAYTLDRYDAIHDPMPTHFGISGEPDRWSRKSAGAVMALPIMALVMGVVMGGSAILTGRARRSVRLDDGASLSAQNVFRSAMSRYLAILGLLVAALLGGLSVASVQVASGERRAIPWALALIGLAIFVYAIFGAAYLAIRYGQGGARLEDAVKPGSLTDGLADDRLWRLGLFYVNRADPSWLVERRFGFGYTLNFGNPKAVAAFCAFMTAIIGLAVWAALSS